MRKLDFIKNPVVFMLLGLFFACGAGGPSPKSAAAGEEKSAPAVQSAAAETAPDFTLNSIDGQPVSLNNFEGKVVIVDFWATWCPPCVKGVPEFSELYNSYKDKGLAIVGISVDRGGPSVVQKFVEKNGVPYTIVMADMKVVDAYQVFSGIPTTFIIDRQGRVADKVIGYHPKSYFEEQINKLL